jgi:hypothetical protein
MIRKGYEVDCSVCGQENRNRNIKEMGEGWIAALYSKDSPSITSICNYCFDFFYDGFSKPTNSGLRYIKSNPKGKALMKRINERGSVRFDVSKFVFYDKIHEVHFKKYRENKKKVMMCPQCNRFSKMIYYNTEIGRSSQGRIISRTCNCLECHEVSIFILLQKDSTNEILASDLVVLRPHK